MKLRWFLLTLTSIVLLSSPVKAQSKSNINQSPELTVSSHSLKNLSSLPEIKFIPPNSENIPINRNTSPFTGISLGKEMTAINAQIRALMNQYSFLSPGMFFLDLQTGDYLDINGDKVFSAASTIKFPILIALFQEVEAGRVRLDEILVKRRDLVANGSGTMRFKPVGSRFSVLATATQMMTISDNTATNMIIDRLGGKAVLNERFRSWGLQNTVIRNLLTDANGTNTTSPKDLVRLAAFIANNQLISNTSNLQVLEMMRHCRNQSMLPSGLGAGAVIAHKTGTLRFVLGDVGIIQTPNGKRYLAGILVRRPNHDKRATVFIRQVSRFVYNYFNDEAQVTSLPSTAQNPSQEH